METTQDKSVAQLRAELAAKEQLLAKEKEELELKSKKALAEERRKAEEKIGAAKLQERHALLVSVHAALRDAGVPCKLSSPGEHERLWVGHDTGTGFNVVASEEYTSGSWHSKPTGRHTLVVESHHRLDGKSVRYPQSPKTGKHNIAKLVATVQERWLELNKVLGAAAERDKRKNEAELFANNLRLEYWGEFAGKITGTYYALSRLHIAKPGHVFVDVGTMELNPAQVAELDLALAAVSSQATKDA